MKKGGIYVFLLALVILPGQDSEKSRDINNTNKFLENLHAILKKMIEARQKAEIRRKMKRKDKKVKIAIRKGIIKKLSTPSFLRPQHSIIKVYEEGKKNKDKNSDFKDSISGTEEKNSNSATISKNTRKYVDSLFSFKIIDFKKFLKQANIEKKKPIKETSDNLPSISQDIDTTLFFDDVVEWIREYIKKPAIFWSTVINLFGTNLEGQRYFEKNVCKGISSSVFFSEVTAINNFHFENTTTIKELIMTSSMVFHILPPERILQLSNTLFGFNDYNKIARKKVFPESELCKDLVIIYWQGIVISNEFQKVAQCSNRECIISILSKILTLSYPYFRNMKYVFHKKLSSIYIQLKHGEFQPNSVPTTYQTLLNYLYYDTFIKHKISTIAKLVGFLKENKIKELEQRYSCKYDTSLIILLERLLLFTEEKVDEFIKMTLQSYTYSEILNNLKLAKDGQLWALLNLFRTLQTDERLFNSILESEPLNNLLMDYDNFINNILNNLKSKKETLCNAVLLGYIFPFIKNEGLVILKESFLKPYIEGAIFYAAQEEPTQFNYKILKSLFGNMTYLPIAGYLFYTTYYGYIFSKCVVKKEDEDIELKRFVEKNRCIFEGKAITCSGDLGMKLLKSLLWENEAEESILLKNLMEAEDKIIKYEWQVPSGENIKNICNSFGFCRKFGQAHLNSLCSLAEELVKNQYTFCPDELKECKEAVVESLCYIKNINGDECDNGMTVCLSPEKCQTETCKKYIVNEMDIFLNTINQKAQFCKVLKTDLYNCCKEFGEYADFITSLLEVCDRGYYRINSLEVDKIKNDFNKFINESLGSNFLGYMKSRIYNLEKEPFEIDDCSKVFQ